MGRELRQIRQQVGGASSPVQRGAPGTYRPGDRLGFYDFQSSCVCCAKGQVATVKANYKLVNQDDMPTDFP
jgi:hypothetical protein